MDQPLLLEGTRGHTSTTCARREVHIARARDAIPRKTGRVPSWNVLAIARHAGGATIEERTTLWVVGVVRPIVIGKGALVATLVPQHLLESPGEVAVPHQEVTSAVDAE